MNELPQHCPQCNRELTAVAGIRRVRCPECGCVLASAERLPQSHHQTKAPNIFLPSAGLLLLFAPGLIWMLTLESSLEFNKNYLLHISFLGLSVVSAFVSAHWLTSFSKQGRSMRVLLGILLVPVVLAMNLIGILLAGCSSH